ncbi:MAG: phosphatidate cytidylyltransferase, partial [Pseudobdellovibrio sp.]
MNNNYFHTPIAWDSPVYRQTVLIVLLVIFFSAAVNFIFRKKTHFFMVSWASLKSWLILAPA